MSKLFPILTQLFESYPNNRATEGTVAMYLRLLADIPSDELQAVIDQCVSELKFLPTIAEIKERHRALSAPDLAESAAEQWGQVTKAIIQVGHVQTPNFRNPITARVVAAMGWRELCMSENQMADRAHFLKMYQSIAERDASVARLTPAMRQLAERKGGLKPISESLPVGLIGDADERRN